MATYSTPPLPPSVTGQQSSPLAQYAQQGQQGQDQPEQASPPQNIQQFNSLELVQSMLNDVTNKLEQVAKVLLQDKPELVAYLKPAVNGLVMLTNALQQNKSPQQGSPGEGKPQMTQAAMQEPQGSAGAISA